MLIEAMASGVPALGISFAQSVETYVNDNINGWTFDPTSIEDNLDLINRALSCSPEQLLAMGQLAKKSVASISPSATADCFCKIVRQLVISQDE
jgi:glycosyltransferase involved in cell wall biosynthesis